MTVEHATHELKLLIEGKVLDFVFVKERRRAGQTDCRE
jgi:hypothetical protein